MAIKLHAKNFQSWDTFDLEIGYPGTGGVTVVVGDSNLGKSAITRALKGLIRNELKHSQTRIGSDVMEVTAIIEGHTYSAQRKNKKSASIEYTIDGGEPYKKLNQAVPQPVLDLLMGEVEIGDTSLDPIFATQFGGQFMLEESPGARNAILGAFSATEKLEAGKRLTNAEIAEKNTEARKLAIEIQTHETREAKLAAIDDGMATIQREVDRLDEMVQHRQAVLAAIDVAVLHIQRRNHILVTLGRLNVPDADPVAHSMQLITALDLAQHALASHTRMLRTLEQLRVPDPVPVASGIQLISALSSAATAKARHNHLVAVLSKLVVPSVAPIERHLRIRDNAQLLRTSSSRLLRIEKCQASAEQIVAGWTHIVNNHRRVKALSELVTAREALTSSKAQACIVALDELTGKLEISLLAGGRLREIVTATDTLIASKWRQLEVKGAKYKIDGELSLAEAKLAAIQADERTAIESAQAEGVHFCGKCGECITLTPNNVKE